MVRALLGLWLGWAGPTSEDPWSLSLSWDAPQTCPDAAAVRHEVRLRARDPSGDVQASGVVTHDPQRGTFVLDLAVRGAAGQEQRHIEAQTCEAIAEVAGLLIAVAADPTLAEGSASDADGPGGRGSLFTTPSTPTRTAEPSLPMSEPPGSTPNHSAGAPADPPTAPPHAPVLRGGFVRFDGVGQLFKVLPGGGLGLGGAGGLTLGRFRVELRGRYFLSQREAYAERPEITGDFDLWTLGTAGCWEPVRGRWSLPLCGGAEAGAMRGRTSGVREPGEAGSLWAGLTVDAAVTYSPVAHLALWAGPQGVLAVARPRFHVRELGTLFRAGPAALRLGFGVEVRFP